MSNTESFEYALWKAIDDCKIDENADTITGSYIKSLSNQDRVVAAHIREIRDTAQQEYHRGFNDGEHSMDAEHRAIAMRLRALPLDGGSHDNLSNIARAVYHADFGWTKGSCAALRDKLVRLMGGVSDENVHVGGLRCNGGCMGDVSNGEDTGRTHDSPSNRDRNHMAVRVGVDTVIGDSDDTCGSQCCGACAACDGRDSGEHAEVSDDCVDCDILGPDSRGHAVGCDFHELGVSDGGVADDCGADTGCGDRGGGVHMAGVTTYNVLDNERRKAVCELRKLDGCSPTAHNFRDALAASLSVPKDGAPYDDKELCHLICDRLIHLLGGDQPSGIDVLRAMDNNGTMGQDNGTCPDDDLTPSITDELRKFTLGPAMTQRVAPDEQMTARRELQAIADRIDERFDRICQQQEAVLQETIAEVVEECDHWKQVVDIKAKVLLEISGENVSLKAECEKLEKQRNELQIKLEISYGKQHAYKMHIAQMDGGSKRLRDEVKSLKRSAERDADQMEALSAALDDMTMERDDLLDLLKDAVVDFKNASYGWDYAVIVSENITMETERNRLAKERDELRRKVDELESFDPETSIAAFGDDNDKLRRLLSRAATLLANAEQDRDANYAYWMDCKEKVVHANATIEELQAKLDAIRDALDG